MQPLVRIVAAVLVCWLALWGVVWAAPQLSISQDWSQYYPYGVLPGGTLTKHCWLKNVGDAELVTTISIDSLYPSSPEWFTLSSTGPLTIQPGDSVQVTVSVLGVGSPGTTIRQFAGFWFVSNSPGPNDSLYDSIMADSPGSLPPYLIVDTIATGCTQLLLAGGTDMGNQGLGRVNMDYFNFGDCDTSEAILGQSDVYLHDGSPVILQGTNATTYSATWSIYGEWSGDAHAFRNYVDVTPPIFSPLDTVTSEYEMVQSGQWRTCDSLLAVEMTYYAPRNAGDSCNFIVRKMAVFPTHSFAMTNLAIGDAVDWDIPSDTAAHNRGGFDAGRNLVYQRGWDKPTDPTQCQPNESRFGGIAMLGWYRASEVPTTFHTDMYAGYTALNSEYVTPTGSFVPSELGANMSIAGLTAEPVTGDLHTVLTYRYNYTLPATDTLIVWSVLATVRNGSVSDLQSAVDKARRWQLEHFGPDWICCWGTTGEMNGDGTVDIGDIDCLISPLFFGYFPPGCCDCEVSCDVNRDGIRDISDLVMLIDYLFFGAQLPSCW